MLAHAHYFRYNGDLGPFDTEDLRELFQVYGGCFSDTVDSVAEPRHTQVSKLFIEEGFSELIGK